MVDMIRSQVRKTVTATVTATAWEEAHYDAPDGQPALAQAEFPLTYQGDLVGESTTRLLLVYTGGDPAEPATLVGEYIGFERVAGTLDARTGTCVARTKGRIVPDSATGDLVGLRGELESAASDMTYQVTISYAFDDPAVH
jgi:Protein of unknown function (DUF3224)